ncbi:helix-turn-helix domain-containing protein [Streptomyces sp. IBSNAI002]|uniref:helix-turn-helix domain-containing protein n=1 Tax=Streptomyces sp. IBSNAI002 TaxID=3457500 RepID=UPI003FD00160
MPESSGLDGAMDRRRVALGLTWRQVAERAGISYETLRAVRKGEQAGGDLTRRGLERALLWVTGGFEVAERGDEPSVQPEGPAPEVTEAQGESPADPQVEAILTILNGLPERVQEEVRRRLGEKLPPAVQESRKAS